MFFLLNASFEQKETLHGNQRFTNLEKRSCLKGVENSRRKKAKQTTGKKRVFFGPGNEQTEYKCVFS